MQFFLLITVAVFDTQAQNITETLKAAATAQALHPDSASHQAVLKERDGLEKFYTVILDKYSDRFEKLINGKQFEELAKEYEPEAKIIVDHLETNGSDLVAHYKNLDWLKRMTFFPEQTIVQQDYTLRTFKWAAADNSKAVREGNVAQLYRIHPTLGLRVAVEFFNTFKI